VSRALKIGGAIAALGLVAVVVTSMSSADQQRRLRSCGTRQLYGAIVKLREQGHLIPCRKVRRIARGRCDLLAADRGWGCFSSRPPGPILFWFPTKERFQFHYSTVIKALRYPCAVAKVTSMSWSKSLSSDSDTTFPTRTQVLADDLIRCHLLDGMTRDQVLQLLGPGEESQQGQRTYLDYEIGPERDSFFQVDSEFLSVQLDAHGTVAKVTQEQG
jgi:hypothetical protein